MKIRVLATAACCAGLLACLPTGGARAGNLPAALLAGDLAAWSERLDWPDDCRPEEMPPEPLSVTSLSVTPLAESGSGEGDWLLLATCRLHAYQATARAWRVRADAQGALRILPLLFPFLVEHEGQATLAWRAELVGLATPEAEGLSLVTRARGLGDCGEAIAWDLSEPLPVAVRYRSRPDCPERPVEADAGWTAWPALAGDWLRARRPEDRSWRAAEALARLHRTAPDLALLPGSLLEADLDCDGTAGPWALGLAVEDAPPSATLLSSDGAAFGPIPVDSARQLGLCGLDLATRVETGGRCPVLVVEDGLCDALRLTRDPARQLWEAERN